MKRIKWEKEWQLVSEKRRCSTGWSVAHYRGVEIARTTTLPICDLANCFIFLRGLGGYGAKVYYQNNSSVYKIPAGRQPCGWQLEIDIIENSIDDVVDAMLDAIKLETDQGYKIEDR